jgi:diguanylate cyclase
MREMGDDCSNKVNRLNLTEALRILQNAGLADDRLQSEDSNTQIQYIIDSLCDLSIHDGLTGLVNATFFHVVFSREIERSLRTGRPCGLMLVDLDHFKKVNDTYGHHAGDKAIQTIAAIMKSIKRGMDTAARVGGEEFAIILPECTPEDAIRAATRIHSTMNPFTVALEDSVINLTTSVGLVWTDSNKSISSSQLLAEADQEMYKAKRSGRGRLCYKQTESTLVTNNERSALMSLRFEELNGH